MRRVLYVLLAILVVPTVGLVGDIVTDGKFKSTLSTGAPLEVDSPDMVVNLNADMVDGVEGTDIYTKAEVDALVTTAVASAGRKRFYITITNATGDSALSVCATGFHMGTFYEISEPSSLIYAYDATDAWTAIDSGVGPPTCVEGWVRTGYINRSDEYPGAANCNTWTSALETDYGTVVSLNCSWPDPTLTGLYYVVSGTPWVSRAIACSTDHRVWCVED